MLLYGATESKARGADGFKKTRSFFAARKKQPNDRVCVRADGDNDDYNDADECYALISSLKDNQFFLFIRTEISYERALNPLARNPPVKIKLPANKHPIKRINAARSWNVRAGLFLVFASFSRLKVAPSNRGKPTLDTRLTDRLNGFQSSRCERCRAFPLFEHEREIHEYHAQQRFLVQRIFASTNSVFLLGTRQTIY